MNKTTMYYINLCYCAFAAFAALIFLNCTSDISGGGSEAGNSRITGMITNDQGIPAANVIVQLLPSDYNPQKDKPLADSTIDTTADDGIYKFVVAKGGSYSIQAVQQSSRIRGLVTEVKSASTDDTVAAFSLKSPGTVKVLLPDTLTSESGYLYVPGTTILVHLNEMNSFAILDSVPAGIIPSIYYASTFEAKPAIIRNAVEVVSGDTVTIPWQGWGISRKIFLNTSGSGANVQETVYHFPVLIRLSAANFVFSQAKSGGEDIRFTSSSGRALPYEIEQWDRNGKRADIWVNVDTVYGNDSTHYIMMHWSNADASDKSNSVAVFDTSTGFQGVWHLTESQNTVAHDATANHYDGMPSDTAPTPASGVIGTAMEFNGVSNGIRMKGTAGSKLNFNENGCYTVSAWVYSDTLDEKWHLIVGKGNQQYYLKQQLKSRYGFWEFAECNDQSAWQLTTTTMTQKVWKYLTGVRNGDKQYLYLDGQLADSTIWLNTDAVSRNTSEDVTIGRHQNYIEYADQGYCHFDGKIDEVRIASTSCSPDWIKLCYMNQREDDKLIVFKE